jgi:hypothetical protein
MTARPKHLIYSVEFRNELDRAKNGRAIRVAIYDVGLLLGLLYAAEKTLVILPEYAFVAVGAAVWMWLYMAVARWRDWRALTSLEKNLDEDEDAGETPAAQNERRHS